jgi:hypothetical protein
MLPESRSASHRWYNISIWSYLECPQLNVDLQRPVEPAGAGYCAGALP